LNSTTEGNLDLFDYHVSGNLDLDDHGRSNDNSSDNWVGLANLSLTYIAPTSGFPSKYWTLGNSTVANYTWLGAEDTDWNNGANWVGGVPNSGKHTVIPDASTTIFDPVLPLSATIGSIIIQTGGILNGGTGTTLNIDGAAGAWDNMGTFNPGTSTIVFTNAAATMSDPTNFYNMTVADGAKLTLGTANVMRIAGTLSLSNTGILNAAYNQNTIEYNGTNQTVIVPNGSTPGYYNLILSGSGIKTLPTAALSVYGDFTISGSTTVTAASVMNIDGEFTLENGSTFNTGNYNHFIKGAFDNNGTFNAASGYSINLNGTAPQSIYGSVTSDFGNLIINNSNGVSVYSNVNVNNVLTLTSGNLIIKDVTLGVNGTITKTSGNLEVSPQSSLSIGGTPAITITNDLFTTLPSINNLTLNRVNGVTLGNQNMTVNGLLNLASGTFNPGANTLTIAGSSPTRATGNIDASNAGATLVFANYDAIMLPPSIFTGSINNLTISGAGGVTACSDLSVNGILNLQCANPSAFKGSLHMWDGAVVKTLTMGANATSIGIGDATGIIRRTSILPEVTYSFGNKLTTAYFPNNGTLPSQMSVKVSIGTAPSWRPGSIDREIEIIQTGGSGTKGLFSYNYLDSELNGNAESNLVFWVKWNNFEYGRSAYNAIDNWVSLSNVDVAFFSSSWDGTKNITLDEYSNTSTLTWNGSVSNSWTSVENWTPNAGPSPTKNIIIPDASTTLYSPTLPSLTEIKTLTIDAAGILNSVPDAQLTISGGGSAWINSGGTFSHNTSNVIFNSAIATISGTTDFFDVTINNGAALSMTSGSLMRISGAMHNNGIWHAVMVGESTSVEYNGGNQTIVIPNMATHRYSKLILSGTGIKTMPATALNILGDFTISGTTSASALNAISTDGDFTIESGTTFNTGVFSHSIGGNFSNNGTFDATGSTITFNGTSPQNIDGNITGTSFNNLLISNSSAGGVLLGNNLIVNNNITITIGSKLSISPATNLTVTGAFANNAGESGLVVKSGGSLIENNGVSATVEREITGDEWHLISSPVSDATSGIFTGKYLQTHTESTNAFTDIIPTNVPLTAMKGYALWGVESISTVAFPGTLNTGTQSYSTSYSGPGKGWNLVGNPYPSSIDWNAASGWTKTNVNGSIYLHVNAAT
ncbi:MAG: beta strand repeat-containing protein, partial [Bacteroidales bacterium]